MADKNPRRNPTTDALFDAILSLETREECYNFFEDLCTVKEISDMAQRLEAAKLRLTGGAFGAEASIFSSLILLMAVLYLLIKMKKDGSLTVLVRMGGK